MGIRQWFLCTLWHGDNRHRAFSNQSFRSGLICLRMPGLSWPNHCHLYQEATGRNHSIRADHVLSLGHWSHILGTEGLLGSYLSSFLYCWGSRTALPGSINHTTKLHFQKYSSGSFIFDFVNLCCTPQGKRVFSQSGSFWVPWPLMWHQHSGKVPSHTRALCPTSSICIMIT